MLRFCITSLLLTLLVAGCASVSTIMKAPADAAAPLLELKEPLSIAARTGPFTLRLSFPAGLYRPALQDERGTYYFPPAAVLERGRELKGLYVVVRPDGLASGVWIDGQPYVYELGAPLPLTPQ